jgi:hypothetical protein
MTGTSRAETIMMVQQHFHPLWQDRRVLCGGAAILGLLFWGARPRTGARPAPNPLQELMANLNCTREQAQLLLQQYDGDLARVIADVRLGKRPLPQMTVEQGYTVLAPVGYTGEIYELTRWLAQAADLTQLEAQRRVGSGGLLARGLSQAAAEAFVRVLSEHGCVAGAVAATDLISPTMGGDAAAVELEPKLRFALRVGAPVVVDRVRGLCIGVIGGKDCKPAADGTMQAGRGKLVAHLYVGEPVVRLQIDARSFNYTGLGERKRESSITNFQVLIEELLRQWPEARTNPSVSLLLKDLRARLYPTEQALTEDGIAMLSLHPV